MVTASGGAKVLDGISGIEDGEQQRQEMTLYERAGESRGSFRLREEIEAPFATEVLYSEVHWGAEGRISRQRRNMPGGYAVHIGAGTDATGEASSQVKASTLTSRPWTERR